MGEHRHIDAARKPRGGQRFIQRRLKLNLNRAVCAVFSAHDFRHFADEEHRRRQAAADQIAAADVAHFFKEGIEIFDRRHLRIIDAAHDGQNEASVLRREIDHRFLRERAGALADLFKVVIRSSDVHVRRARERTDRHRRGKVKAFLAAR